MSAPTQHHWLSILWVFLQLGVSSFGGPVAHLGFYHAELVKRRAWLSEQELTDLITLGQFLPGPASSQVGFAAGYRLGGWAGAFAAWAGFTLPSVFLLGLFAWWITAQSAESAITQLNLHGLKWAVVAIVAQAVASMWRSLVVGTVGTTPNTPSRPNTLKPTLALGSAAALLWIGKTSWLPLFQLVLLVIAAGLGWRYLRPTNHTEQTTTTTQTAQKQTTNTARWPRSTFVLLTLYAVPLLLLPLLSQTPLGQFPALAPLTPLTAYAQFLDPIYRAGALVFGGGHVVLPMLEGGLVPVFVSKEAFLAGYGAANAVPGPLFTFASYLGAIQTQVPSLWGYVLATVAIFFPGFVLMIAALPLWQRWTHLPTARGALNGMNAAVVGLLIAALYDPVFVSAVRQAHDLAVVLLAYLVLTVWRWPSWLVVLICGVLGGVLGTVLS